MNVEVLTLSGQKYSNEAKEVMLRTSNGDIVILPNHEPFLAIAVPGALTIVNKDNAVDVFSIFGGVIDVSADKVKILVDEAEHADDLIESEIEEAISFAEALKASAKDRTALNQAQSLLDRHAVRLNVVRVRRHHHNKRR